MEWNCEICSMLYIRSPGIDTCGAECKRAWDEVEIDHEEKSDDLWGELIDKKREIVVFEKAKKIIEEYDPDDWVPDKVDEWTESGYIYSEKYIKTTPVYKWLLESIPALSDLPPLYISLVFGKYLEKLHKRGR